MNGKLEASGNVSNVASGLEAPQLLLNGVHKRPSRAITPTRFVPCGAQCVVSSWCPWAVQDVDELFELRNGAGEKCLSQQCCVHAQKLRE